MSELATPSRRWNTAVLAGIFAAVYVTHFLSGVIASGDSRWTVPGAKSIIDECNTNLDEFPDLLEEHEYYWVDRIDGHFYNRFPIGMTLLATPFVYVIDRVSSAVFSAYPAVETSIRTHCSKPIAHVNVVTMYWRVELIIACLFIALSSVLIYLCARETLSGPMALTAVFVFAFCTSAWSTGSRSLCQHCGSILMWSLVLYGILIARRRPWAIQFVSIPMAFAYVIRPTNAIPIAVLTAYVLIQHRRWFPAFACWSLAVSAPWFVYNIRLYHALLPPYYNAAHQLGTSHFLEASMGLLVSPGRGLFVYTPIFLLCFAGLWARWKKRRLDRIEVALWIIVAVHWLVLATFDDWYGGHSYGPRYFADLTPFLVYLLLPAVALVFRPGAGRRRIWIAALVLTAAISFLMHFRGATSLDAWAWNREPVDVSQMPARLWDWQDPPFLRGLY